MGIKVDDMKLRIFFQDCSDGTQGYKMLPSDHQWKLLVVQDSHGSVFDSRECCFRASEAKLQITAVKHCIVCQILILVRTVGFKSEAFMADSGRAESGSGPKTCGGVKWSAEQDDFGVLVFAVTSNEGFYIFIHTTQPPPAFFPEMRADKMPRYAIWSCNTLCPDSANAIFQR